MSDPYDLRRFVEAQDAGGAYDCALGEIRRGRKNSHWMWFVFPQLAGLGRSEAARYFGLRSITEAQAYLAHPVLGPRLREITAASLALSGKTLHVIFGSPDDLKFVSSMTLFDHAAGSENLFRQALEQFDASPDFRTLELLRAGPR